MSQPTPEPPPWPDPPQIPPGGPRVDSVLSGIDAAERLLAVVWDRLEVPPIRRGGPQFALIEDGASATYESSGAAVTRPFRPTSITFQVVPPSIGPAAGPRDARLPRG